MAAAEETSAAIEPVSESMKSEEQKLQTAHEKEEAKREEELKRQRQQDLSGGKGAVDKKFKALEYLLNQSKVCTRWCG